MLMLLLILQTSSEVSNVLGFLRAARAGNDQQIVECLDAGVDINVVNPVSIASLLLIYYI